MGRSTPSASLVVEHHSTPIQVCNSRTPASRRGRTIPPAPCDAGEEWLRAASRVPRDRGRTLLALLFSRVTRYVPNCQRSGVAARRDGFGHAVRRPPPSRTRTGEPRACRPGAASRIPDPRFQIGITNPQSPLPGFSQPGGAASSAWFRGLLRRPSSAARTTEERPISGRGILPCVVQQPQPPSGGGARLPESKGPKGLKGPKGRRTAEDLSLESLLSLLPPSAYPYGSRPTTRQ